MHESSLNEKICIARVSRRFHLAKKKKLIFSFSRTTCLIYVAYLLLKFVFDWALLMNVGFITKKERSN